MATWADVRRLALALPETDEAEHWSNTAWRVKQKGFVWARPLNKADLKRLAAAGETAPDGPILAVRVEDEGVKGALIASNPDVFFTIEHFNGFNAVLLLLDEIALDELGELITEAWLTCAPAKLAKVFLAENPADT
jgi:hypothetical protein